MNMVAGFQFMNMAAIIQSPLMGAGEKTFRSLTSCEFYLLLSPSLRQEKRRTKAFYEAAGTPAFDLFFTHGSCYCLLYT